MAGEKSGKPAYNVEPNFITNNWTHCGSLQQQVKKELLLEGRKHSATKLLRQIPSIGPIRAVLLLALIQTPHRFRTKRHYGVIVV